MSTSTDAYLAYGFGWHVGALPESAEAVLGKNPYEDGHVDYYGAALAFAAERKNVEVYWHGQLEYSDDGVFFAAKSRVVECELGEVKPVGSLMQSGLEVELQEFSELVELAKELGIDTAEIGWHMFVNRG